jgi:hypothetical protein
MHGAAPLAPRDLVAEIGQRNVGTELHDEICFAVLTRATAFFAGQAHEIAGVFAERERAGHALGPFFRNGGLWNGGLF